MRLLAGTSNGVFAIENGVARQVHGSGDVRDLISSGERVFASTGAGLYRSDDAGESWQLAGMVDREVWQTRSAGNGVWYAGTQPPGLFRSTDDGDSWSEVGSFAQAPEAADWSLPTKPISPARARALAIDRDDPKRIWVGVEVGGIMRTDDGGTSWALVVPGDNPDLHMIYAHPQKPEELYASAGYGRLDGVAEMVEGNAGVFRSDDGGVTWHYAWKGITPRYTRPMCVDPRAPYGLTVASAPGAGSSFKQDNGAQAMLFRSDNGGESWCSLCDTDHTPSRANIHGLSPDPERPGGVVIGTDTGEVWRVSNDAAWTLLGAGMPSVLSIAAF